MDENFRRDGFTGWADYESPFDFAEGMEEDYEYVNGLAEIPVSDEEMERLREEGEPQPYNAGDRVNYNQCIVTNNGNTYIINISADQLKMFLEGLRKPKPVEPDPVEPNPKDEIEKRIKKFNDGVDDLIKRLNDVLGTLQLQEFTQEDVTEAIIDLNEEIEGLTTEAKELMAAIDEFHSKYKNADFSKDWKQIQKGLKELRTKLGILKQKHADKYNARVDLTNKLIDDLRLDAESLDLKNKDPEVAAMISDLQKMDSTREVGGWTSVYWRDIDYKKLVEINKRIAEIRRRIGIKPPVPIEVDLESDMVHIEKEIERVSSEIENVIDRAKNGEKVDDVIKLLNQDLDLIVGNINDFKVKLENNKDKISEDDYNKYLERIEKAEKQVKELREKLNGIVLDNVYQELLGKLNSLEVEVNREYFFIEALYGKITQDAVEVFEKNLATFSRSLEDIEKEIEARHAAGELDENQYNNLIKKVEEIKAVIENARGKVKEPGMIVDVDVFAFLNGRIDGVEKALDSLEQQVDGLDKPIKDRNTRKLIDDAIKRLAEEIKDIEKQLERYKNENPEKYEEAKERLEQAKERLDKISKKYRAKCPLIIRAVKGAKDFYKKHKKVVLIAAGLAAIALLHATVGPILIPAIMHGNIMIAAKAPALRGFIKFANNILGGLIGATKNAHGIWSLANGVMINPSVAATSLLKGLAISGIGNTLLIAPIVVAIKKLVDKMKQGELKQKITEEIEKRKKAEKPKKPKNEGRNKDKRAGKDAMEEMVNLCRDYQKSGMSIEEYCEDRKLTDQERELLEYFVNRKKENLENNSGRGGRR